MHSRLPYLRYDDLDADGRAVWDGVVGSRGGDLVGPEGGLIGPFNAFVHAPGVGRRLSSLGQVLRFETSIERRLSEVAIITVGARWKAEFEWWAHARMAREHGVPGAVVYEPPCEWPLASRVRRPGMWLPIGPLIVFLTFSVSRGTRCIALSDGHRARNIT